MNTDEAPNHLSPIDVLDHIKDGVLITDLNGRVEFINKSFSTLTDYPPQDIIGQPVKILKSDKHPPTFYAKILFSLKQHETWKGDIWFNRKNGTAENNHLSITPLKNHEKITTHYVAIFSDISLRKEAEDLMRRMAFYDPLTNLPNRTLFRDRLKHSLAAANRSKTLLAVLLIDLDQVKVINDTLGHAMGDELLRQVAARLTSNLREADTVARMGGDEFMIILPDLDRPEDINKTTEKILECLKPAFRLGNHDIFITASIGISIFPHDGADPESLTKNADTAMFKAKKMGRNNCQLYTPAMKQEVFEQLVLDTNLRKALDNGEFSVHYQPQIDTVSGQVVTVEALLRWNHPRFGVIRPNRFIKRAEESGLIIPIGEWVLREVCRQNKAWQDAGLPHVRMAVNLSPRQFLQDNFAETVAGILKETGLFPQYLEFELTETTIMQNPLIAIQISHHLKAMGIRLSIDDFGTGYSSLNYLKRLPVNNLKMDQSFVQDLVTDPSDKAIAKAIIALGHSLNLEVVAEGVETEAQRDLLKNYNCDLMQGFLFGHPLPAHSTEGRLRDGLGFSEKSLFAAN